MPHALHAGIGAWRRADTGFPAAPKNSIRARLWDCLRNGVYRGSAMTGGRRFRYFAMIAGLDAPTRESKILRTSSALAKAS